MRLKSDQRLVSFRMDEELVYKLIASGELSEDFSRADLSKLVQEKMAEFYGGTFIVKPEHTKDLRETLQLISQRLDELQGKQSPQAA